MSVYSFKQIPTETQINKFVRRTVFGKNLFCPRCKSRLVAKYENRYRCKACRGKFSLLSYTWLSKMRVSLQDFWLVLWCWTTQFPVRQTEVLTGISEKGVRHWYGLFRKHLPVDKQVLDHIIQLDEAYFGGWKGYTLFIAKQKGERKLAYEILSHNQPNRYEAINFLKEYVKPDSFLHTDGAKIYRGIGRYFPIKHEVDIHKAFEYSKTSEIEGMIGVLRTFIRRMYHHVTPHNFPSIMSEFYYRFSHPEMFGNPRFYLKNTLSLVPIG